MTLKFSQYKLCRASNANSKMKFWLSSIKPSLLSDIFCYLSEQRSFSLSNMSWKYSNKMFFKNVRPSGVWHWKVPSESCVQFPTVTSTLRSKGMREVARHFSGSSRKCLISSIRGFRMVHSEWNSELQIHMKFLLVLLEFRTLLCRTVASFFWCQMESVGKNSTLVSSFFLKKKIVIIMVSIVEINGTLGSCFLQLLYFTAV